MVQFHGNKIASLSRWVTSDMSGKLV